MSTRKGAGSKMAGSKLWRRPGWGVALLLCLVASALALPRLNAVRTLFTFEPPTPATPAVQTTATPSREYIYAGGRLVAIEEPSAASAPAPTGFLATAQPGGQVSMSWSAPSSGVVDHYQVERKTGLADTSPSLFNCPASPCADPSPVAGDAYLYHVRAVFAGGAVSAYSNLDLASTAVFSDDPLNPNGSKTVIKALHFTELRAAVNTLRTAVGLTAFNWAEAAPQSGGGIRASHYNDLRANLAEALGRLGLPGPQSAPAGSGAPVAHQPVQELRDLMR